MAANWATAAVKPGSRSTPTRVSPGVISLSSSNHFPLMLYSNWVNPVALRPGRDMLSTKPAPTGSGTTVNTIGTMGGLQQRSYVQTVSRQDHVRHERY